MLKRAGFLFAMRYQKPPLTFGQQIKLLEERGLRIPDKSLAESYLSNIGYYRLSAYMLPLKAEGLDEFRPNISFDDVIRLWRFDRELRVFLFDYVERLEIVFRTQLAYFGSLESGPWWFEYPAMFRYKDAHAELLVKIDEDVRRAKEVFKDHFFGKYTGHSRMPAWMTFELTSLGLLSKLYRSMRQGPLKHRIASHFKVGAVVLESWMQALAYLRNSIAHHGRIWNRVMTVRPAYPQTSLSAPFVPNTTRNDKIYFMLGCVLYMMRAANPNTRFLTHFKLLLSRYPEIALTDMGFPDDWEEMPFWH